MKKTILAILSGCLALAAATISGPATCQQNQVCTYTASGGTGFTYSLVAGSVGTINASTGTYLAPAKVTPKHVIAGCQAFPNNNIFNTRIDNLPVHASSALWMANIDQGVVSAGGGMRINTVLSTDATTAMSFYYTPSANGNFIFAPFPERMAESGGALTAPGFLPSKDNHFLTVYRDTCQLQETYQLYSTGVLAGEGAVNSQSGLIVDLKDNALPGYGTDAAGLPVTPLLTHQDELIAAANGDVDAIKHAVRITIDSSSVQPTSAIWPSQPQTASGFCQGPPVGGNTWNVIGDGTTTVTPATRSGQTHPDGFHPWPAGTLLTVDGTTSYTVASVSTPDTGTFYFYYLSMVLTTPLSSGAHTITQPGASCIPYGARLRLKSSFVPRFVSTCNLTCQNVARAIYRAQQNYGIFIADAGSTGNGQSEGDYDSYDISAGLANAQCTAANCAFDQLLLNPSNYDVVDESTLQTSRTQVGAVDNDWMEVKLGNAYVTPDNAAVVKAVDSLGATAYYSVSLQGVAVGVEHPNEVVMAGASPFMIHPWVTGSPNASYTCTLSPSGGKYGTITSGCQYIPPAASAVPAGSVTTSTITVGAVADSTARKSIAVQVIPVAADGKMYLSLGKESTSASYTDTNGHAWINDKTQGLVPAITPDDAFYPFTATWSDYVGTYHATSPGIFNAALSAGNDIHLRVHVPSGSATGSAILENIISASTYGLAAGFSFDCNGNAIIAQSDLYTFSNNTVGAVQPLTCTETASTGNGNLIHMVVRRQGVLYGPNTAFGCAINCYLAPNYSGGASIAGLVITPSVTPVPTSKKVTVCASGCDYLATTSCSNGLCAAMQQAAVYQDTVACIPYVIEGTGTIQMSGIPFPPKVCGQYVEIRSSQGSHFTPGQRYSPSTDDAYAFGLQGAKVLGNASVFGTSGGTRYWRFRNVNFFTDDTGGATHTVTGATWSGGIATVTFSGGATIPSVEVAVNGISPSGFNIGDMASIYPFGIRSSAPGVISYSVPNDPGAAYASGGTITELYQYQLSYLIQWGGGFDLTQMPDHLEIIQCALHGDGDGDSRNGLFVSGENVRVIDSFLGGTLDPNTDSGPVVIEYGSNLDFRNNTIADGSENFGIGGSHVAAGTIPRFVYVTGNSFYKSPWMGTMSGTADPNSPAQPCWQGMWYHRATTTINTDYLCSSTSGVWNAQSSLLTKSQLAPKNFWECKICQGVRIVGNDFGLITGQTTQGATGIVLNLVNQPFTDPACPGGIPWPCTIAQTWNTIADANIQANRFHDGFSPFGLAYSDPVYHQCTAIDPGTGLPYAPPCYSYSHHNINFTHNLITNVSDERSYCPSYGSGPGGYCAIAANSTPYQTGVIGPLGLDGPAYDIDISNNTQTTSTFSAASGVTFGFGTNVASSHDFSGMVHARNNIGPIGHYGFYPGNACSMEAMFLLYGGALDLHKNILTNDPSSGDTWQSFTTGSVTPACALSGSQVWPTDHAGGMSWASILNTSTFKVNAGGTACNTRPCAGFGSDGRDPGADVDLVNWKTAHALDGAPNPNLDYKIKSIVPTSTGASVYFTAPTTAACTWELSTDAGLYSSPIAVTSQTRTGRDGVATWTGSLSASTGYFARATCAGNKLEFLVNGERAMVITAPAATLLVDSYDMFNGVWHRTPGRDLTYAGVGATGDPTAYHAALAGGKGYLTDGILGARNPFARYPFDEYNVTAASTNSCVGGCVFTFTVDRPSSFVSGSTDDYIGVDGALPSLLYDDPYDPYQSVTNTSSTSTIVTYPTGYESSPPPPYTSGGILTKLIGSTGSLDLYNYITWATDPSNSPQPTDFGDIYASVVFKLHAQSDVHQVSIWEANKTAYGIDCFATAVVDFSNDGTTFTNQFTYPATSGDLTDNVAHWVNIPVSPTVNARYVRVHMTHSAYPNGNAIAVSEVKFQ
jgi:hypothetical protein